MCQGSGLPQVVMLLCTTPLSSLAPRRTEDIGWYLGVGLRRFAKLTAKHRASASAAPSAAHSPQGRGTPASRNFRDDPALA